MNKETSLINVAEVFSFQGDIKEIKPYGEGHINNTYLVITDYEGREKRYIIQRINKNVFKNPPEVMENIAAVTEHLGKKIQESGGNPLRETLSLISTLQGENYHRSAEDEYWRAYNFIEGATTYMLVEKPEDFYNTGNAIGRFQRLLADFPAHSLHETIVDFHNTEKRFRDFIAAVEEDKVNRAQEAAKEIEFIKSFEKESRVLNVLLEDKKVPLRVTHNDTKFNNILIDDESRKGICVLDLDTVMPGLALYDFGDSIRSGATTALEDEEDLSKVALDLTLFEAYTKGYLEEAREFLNDVELNFLPFSAMIMTYECGMRFLTDYLQGDVYFKVHRDNHNLIRARNQIKLVQDMQKNLPEMSRIVNSYIL